MKVVVADDQLIFAEAAAALLGRNGHEVVGCLAAADEVTEVFDADPPDVLLIGLDVDGNRCSTIGELARRHGSVPLVAMSESPDGGLLNAALDAGASGVFLKTEGVDELERLLGELFSLARGAHDGQRGRPKLWSKGAAAAARRSAGISGAPAVTMREREVLARLSRGESTARIARGLGVGTATVRTHVQNLFYKFGTHSRLELLAQARRAGLLTSLGDARGDAAPRSGPHPAGATEPPGERRHLAPGAGGNGMSSAGGANGAGGAGSQARAG